MIQLALISIFMQSGTDENAVVLAGPGAMRACKFSGVAPITPVDYHAGMSRGVEKGMDDPGVVRSIYYGLFTHVGREKVTWIGALDLMPENQPPFAKRLYLFKLINARVTEDMRLT